MARNYVNNKEMFDAFVAHKKKVLEAKEAGKLPPVLPDYLGRCFMLIAERTSMRPNFAGYTYRDEMVSDGIENCIIAANNFDPDKGQNPFAYFTQIIWFAFLRRIEKEKKHTYIKYKSLQNMNINGETINGNMEDFKGLNITVDNEFMDEIVNSFDEKKKKKDDKYQANKKKKGLENFFETEDETPIVVEDILTVLTDEGDDG